MSATVKGLAELQAALDNLPVQIERNIMRGALRAGSKVQMAAALSRVPVGPPSSEGAQIYGGYAGALRDSLRIKTSSRNGTVRSTLQAGTPKGKGGADVFYAHFVEFGTAAHLIKPQKGRDLGFAGHFGAVVHHPGARMQPYMRPALDSTVVPATQAVGEYVRQRLTKEGLTGPGPDNS